MSTPHLFKFLVAVTLITWTSHAAPATTGPVTTPGLALTFTTADGKTDTRLVRLPALLVPAGTSPTPFLAPGPFKAKFEGYFAQKLRGEFRFSATGNGTVKILLDDKPIFDATGDLGAAEEKPATLKKGKNKITVEYESPATGDASLRVAWSADDFSAEPIDPNLLSHAAGDPIAVGATLREGRALFADMHCARCHADASLNDPKTAMPELAKDAPNLDAIGARLNEKWMARWIADPKSLRPDTSMPNLFHGKPGQTPQEAADVAAYLSQRGDKPEGLLVMKDADALAGGRLVASLGCIGCHTLPDKDVTPFDAHGRVSWHYVKAKYQTKALVAFLKKPEEHYAWIRMPNFRLSDDEARQIAAYLLANSKDLEGDAPKGNATNGAKLVQSAGCINCHQVPTENGLKVPPIAAANKGCVAKDDAARGNAPDFGLTDPQRVALTAFLATDRSSLKRDVPAEFAARQVVELRCTACHTRDGLLDTWDELAKEVEPLAKGETTDPESGGGGAGVKGSLAGEPQPGTGDQSRPPLTWTGEKLKPEWMATFIAGKLDYKPRVWMKARMPGFPARGAGLAVGLAQQHACPATSPEEKPADEELAKIGKGLVSRNGGFSCVQCHGIANIAPIAPFEAPSINFKYANERLRKEYFDRWMRDPIRVVPTTKMPKFQNDGKTALSEILEGDADKQFDAIWDYLKAGRKIEHPEE